MSRRHKDCGEPPPPPKQNTSEMLLNLRKGEIYEVWEIVCADDTAWIVGDRCGTQRIFRFHIERLYGPGVGDRLINMTH